jgi:hypothetical protein
VAEKEDEHDPGVAEAGLQPEIGTQAENGGLGDDGFVIVLECIGDAELFKARSEGLCVVETSHTYNRHQLPVDLADNALVSLAIKRDGFKFGDVLHGIKRRFSNRRSIFVGSRVSHVEQSVGI